MSATIEIDLAVEAGDWDEASAGLNVREAVDALSAELALDGESELSVVLTNDRSIRALNRDWRGKDKPTNVLSFPAFQVSPGSPLPPMLGDVVIAAETVRREAADEGKPLAHHLRHLVIHGVLHLLGYDHETDEDADLMEGVERRALARLAIPDPYA